MTIFIFPLLCVIIATFVLLILKFPFPDFQLQKKSKFCVKFLILFRVKPGKWSKLRAKLLFYFCSLTCSLWVADWNQQSVHIRTFKFSWRFLRWSRFSLGIINRYHTVKQLAWAHLRILCGGVGRVTGHHPQFSTLYWASPPSLCLEAWLQTQSTEILSEPQGYCRLYPTVELFGLISVVQTKGRVWISRRRCLAN